MGIVMEVNVVAFLLEEVLILRLCLGTGCGVVCWGCYRP